MLRAVASYPYTGPKEVGYLFIDGASLHGRIGNIASQFLNNINLDVDFARLLTLSRCAKGFYYDAIPVQDDGETDVAYKARIAPRSHIHDRAQAVQGMHVYEGDARKRRRMGYQQKKVDVMIAVDMMMHTFRRNMHHATLLTGDADFKPLIDALIREGMQVTLWYPLGETAQELIDAADIRRPIDFSTIRSVLTDESQRDFAIPGVVANPPMSETAKRVRTWGSSEAQQELWKDGPMLSIVRHYLVDDRYCVTHTNPNLLKAVCAEHPQYFVLPPDLFP
ncbi:NYN domain-containing protein [Reyranella soli]|uniref:NYN domain-containing protein n=1 Tax=Reyranella soli TaxID=1230389 RepID=A0A512N5G5_9HYPH|nr:NYN domain-containing protein [Reyranella soli]GEP53891.1 hypothetical protein RSO01_10570 [Reyranella soli]